MSRYAPKMTVAEAHARLTARGAPFETELDSVRGETLAVFRRRPKSLRQLLVDSARFDSQDYYVFDDGRRATYLEHRRDIASVARALRERFGIGPGDRVAILGANSPEWITSFWAVTSLGAVAVGLNGWWQGDEIEYGLGVSEPKLLIADQRRLDRLGAKSPGMPAVVMEDDFERLRRHALGVGLPEQPIAEDDPALILFTSGTTGRPKGAINTHRNMLSFLSLGAFAALRGMLLIHGELRIPKPGSKPPCAIAASPLFHVSGLHGSAVTAMASGMKLVWTTGRFDAEKIFRLSFEEGITRWGGVTTHLYRLLEHPEFAKHDFSQITSVGGGGSTWSPELQRLVRERLPQAAPAFQVGYGLTESAALLTMADELMLRAHPDCVGAALATALLEIRGEDGRALPEGRDGDICARGPMVMPGYFRNDKANAETIFPGGWLKTGDIGRMQGELLFLATRKRDLILRGAENVYPVEIENRLEEHPGIAEAAVVGVPHRDLGQEVKAVVVPRPGARIGVEELRAFVAERLAYFKVPAHVEFRDEPLPRNAAGKVLKHVLTGEANPFVEE
jgi:acyl-CoA synthetase (AMP-forming)/AMP-acid ligase II